MFDVAIIGAGPAGTAAAFDLLTKGLKVLILDKYEFPRKKACAGGITPKAYQLFKYDISSIIKRECSSVKITPSNKKAFLIRDKNILCYMTRREDLDLLSLNKVMDKGAVFQVVKKVQSINETHSFVEINTNCGTSYKASYLIGADGANSIVRRFISKERFYKKQFAIEADVKIDRPDKHKMEIDLSRSKNGYYWIFPKDDHVNIGMYTINLKSKLQIQRLYDYAKQRLFSTRLKTIKGYPICTGGFKYRPDSNRILLAGDAAGLAEPLLGEGIYFAVKSGQQAAMAILDSQHQRLSARDFYSKKLKSIQTDLKIYELSSKFLYRFPEVSLKISSFPFIHKRFVKGYAKGKTITQIFSGK